MGMFLRYIAIIISSVLTSAVSAQIRVVSYNSAQFKGDANAMSEVLLIAAADDSHGFATPVSIFLFQEVDEAELTLLQSVVGTGYTMATFTDQNDSSWGGAQAMFYLSTQLIEHVPSHNDIFTGASRHADRWGLDVIGYDGLRLYVYSMHLKASTGSENQELRRQGVENVVDDMQTLPAGSNIVVVGDMNFYSSNEPGYGWFIKQGQMLDPLGNGQSWGGESNSIKHTQSPLLNQNGGLVGGGLDDRFDFQLLSPTMFDAEGMSMIGGTYRPLGNDGQHYNDAINAGNNYYFPNDIARSNALADELIIASDHLPLIADYQVPALLNWDLSLASQRVLVGAETSIEITISNDAPVSVSIGADELDVEIEAIGDVAGFESVTIVALSQAEIVSFPIDTTVPNSWNSVVTITATSQETQTTPEVVKLAGDVIEHANASFSYTEDVDWHTYDISFDVGTGVQSFDVWLFNFGYDGSQSLLEIDELTIPDPPLQFSGISTNTVGSLPALMTFEIDTDNVAADMYTSQLPISISDEDLPGEQTGISMLTIRVEILDVGSCDEDFDGDGLVNIADLLVLIASWGGNGSPQDLDGNGTVGVSDLLILIAAWGYCP